MQECMIIRPQWMYACIPGWNGPTDFFVSFQYVCCLKLDLMKEQTLHQITHCMQYITLEKLLQKINEFASEQTNLTWISQVSQSTLSKFSMTASDYVHDLEQSTFILDELAILIACRVFNIHCVVLMSQRYWSTRSDGFYNDCEVKLAFTGNYAFKHIASKAAEELDNIDEDLDGTSNLDQDNGDEIDSEESDCNCEGTCTCENPSDTPTSSDSESEIIELSSTEEDFLLAPHQAGIINLVKTEPTEQTTEVEDQQEPIAGTSSEVKPFKTKCIECKDPYVCHICQKSITIQSDYIKHMKETHPADVLQCDRCSAQFVSPNGLFKHMWSHSYMKYKCDIWDCQFQFPYQINDHIKTHSCKDLYGCTDCDKQFPSLSTCKAHQRSHGVKLKCLACPDSTTKMYSSTTSLNKWKLMYARHIRKCKICIKKLADFRLNRYDFMRHIDLDSVY